ncbi:MAG: hypothetical protein ABIP64_06955 [Burkholderiales bacterium]
MLVMSSARGEEFDVDQFVDSDFGCDYGHEIANELVLICTPEYGPEVQLSGYVVSELQSLEAEMFLEALYKLG